MANTLERSGGGPDWAHGRIGNVVFLDYRTDVPADAVEHSFELITRTVARHSRGIVLIAVFGEQPRVPTAELRRSIAGAPGLRRLGRRAQPRLALRSLRGAQGSDGGASTELVGVQFPGPLSAVIRPRGAVLFRPVGPACEEAKRCGPTQTWGDA